MQALLPTSGEEKIMYNQPTRGPAIPPVIRHIFRRPDAPLTRVAATRAQPSGVLAELGRYRSH
jgi:hypothetical protein